MQAVPAGLPVMVVHHRNHRLAVKQALAKVLSVPVAEVHHIPARAAFAQVNKETRNVIRIH